MLKRISSFAAGPRSKWVVVAVWVLLGVALSPLQPRLQEATTNESEAFLPETAESTEVNDLIEERFADGREVEMLIAYHREGGLTPDDEQRIGADAQALAEEGVLANARPAISPFAAVPVQAPSGDPGSGPQPLESAPPTARGDGAPEGAAPTAGPSLVSEDGSTALVVIPTFSEDSEEIQDNVDAIKAQVPEPGEPLEAYVTGTGGFIADSIAAFESIDGTLLTVTVILVLVLLLLIYRSPVIALVPLVVVGLTYGVVAAVVYALVEAGAFEVNGQTTGILIVLMFGAGTDYCLLIVSRFREELRRTEDKHEAMALATERTAPAILSAGATVFAAMLVLTLADFKATQSMGPVLALGIAVMVLAGLTFLPALLSILGRRAFWPAIPSVGSEQRKPVDVWRRIGHLVHDHPTLAMAVSLLILIAGAFGNLDERGVLDFGEGFRNDPDSKLGQELIQENLTPGQAAATSIVVDAAVADRVAKGAAATDGVESARPVSSSDDGKLVRLDVTLADDPFSDDAAATIPPLRDSVEGAAGDGLALVGGITAENFDTTETLRSDAKIIVPLVLVLILVILAVLLRAIVAPLYLVATVVLSFAFALGTSKLIFTYVFDQPAGDPGLPTFAFIFLVALGVDYNIFLMTRIREETAKLGVKDGVITGLERTGGVITSAGLILAGTFCALASLPLESLFQLGFCVALGLLVDTFLVRTILVPSIAFQLGERNWWPSRGGPRAAPGTPD